MEGVRLVVGGRSGGLDCRWEGEVPALAVGANFLNH